MTGRLKQPIWLVPLFIAALVAVFGWWGNVRLRDTIEQQLTAQLTTNLNANVTALQIWMTNQMKLATVIADEPRVRILAARILEDAERERLAGQAAPDPVQMTNRVEFANILRTTINGLGYGEGIDTFQLVSPAMYVVANPNPRRVFPGMVSEAHTNQLAELFASKEPVIITPYKPEPFPQRPPPRVGRSGQRRAGGSSPTNRGTNAPFRGGRGAPPDAFGARRGDRTLMQVAAPIRAGANVVGALALVINPDHEFTKIISVAQPGQSGETYAFDQHGLLISRSRFDEQLKTLGLLDKTNTSSALNFRLHDPGAEAVEGVKPLTHIVAEAVSGEAGVDVEPSRDYRGVEVVGAWRWLPDHGFGVATQIDADEAFRPLRVLKLLFVLLCLLLVLCATGMFVFSFANFTWRRRLSEAEFKLKQLGQYNLEEKIGEGGMGVVYRARHALMRRDTAVKLLLPDRSTAADIARFEREVCLTCQLTHPNTIQVYDYGHTPEGVFYYAMEFLRGLNLHQLVQRFGPQPEGRVIHILAQVCDSLAEAHALGLVHRDIKPANVFLCHRGGVPDCVKVLDFGLVRHYNEATRGPTKTSIGSGLEGTPSFMPPEALKDSDRSDPRSDIYSVGALAYFLLTGQHVFDAETVLELYEKHLTESPVPPGRRTTNPVSAELEAVILRCLLKNPDQRPQSAAELRDLLLASPRAADWTVAASLAWWADYQTQAAPQPGATQNPASSSLDATVRIDMGSRVG
jgi:hypothetical protein